MAPAGSRTAAMRNAVRYAVKYGPVVLPLVQQARGPATEAARRVWDARRAERTADAHARTLRLGSVLPVVHGGRRSWVVFSADEAVTAYPPTDVPLVEFLVHADLDARRAPRPPRGRPGRTGGSGGTGDATGDGGLGAAALLGRLPRRPRPRSTSAGSGTGTRTGSDPLARFRRSRRQPPDPTPPPDGP